MPLSLNASLVFEQSSAASMATARPPPSCTRCFPRCPGCRYGQEIAVTGSVNQLGVVQAIGGANRRSRDISTFRGAA